MKIAKPKFVLERVKPTFDYYASQGLAPENGIIRIESELKAGQGIYSFDIKKQQALLSPSERSIDQWDLFIVEKIHIGLMVEEVAKPGMSPIMTYPVTGVAGGFATKDIEALYNGGLSIKTGTVQTMSDFPLINFRHVPQTQASATTLAQFDITDAAVQLPEKLIFAGTNQYDIRVSFPVVPTSNFKEYSDNENSTSLSNTKIVLQVFGYRIKGGAAEQYKVSANPENGRF